MLEWGLEAMQVSESHPYSLITHCPCSLRKLSKIAGVVTLNVSEFVLWSATDAHLV